MRQVSYCARQQQRAWSLYRRHAIKIHISVDKRKQHKNNYKACGTVPFMTLYRIFPSVCAGSKKPAKSVLFTDRERQDRTVFAGSADRNAKGPVTPARMRSDRNSDHPSGSRRSSIPAKGTPARRRAEVRTRTPCAPRGAGHTLSSRSAPPGR